MAGYAQSIVINRPVKDVWPLTGNPQGWLAWSRIGDPEVEGGVVKQGAHISYRFGGRRNDVIVESYEEERVYGIFAENPNYDFREWIELTPQGDSTLVTFTMDFKTKGLVYGTLGTLVTPIKRWVLGRPLRKELQALKTAVESRPASVEESTT